MADFYGNRTPLEGVGLLGPGRAGAVVAAALRAAGHPILGWYAGEAPSEATRARADALLPGVPELALRHLVAGSRVVLIAVPDRELDPLVASIAELPADLRAGTVFWHVCGSVGVAPLAPLTGDGADPTTGRLALHPAMTFTGTAADLPRLTGVRWACTTDGAAQTDTADLAHALIARLGGLPVDIAEADRTTYHAALSHASNFLTVLQAQAADLLRSIGVDDPAALTGPLVRSALENALRPEPAYTGPISRGDAATISAHLQRMTDPDATFSYAALSAATLHRLRSAGAVAENAADDVAAVLASALRPPSP